MTIEKKDEDDVSQYYYDVYITVYYFSFRKNIASSFLLFVYITSALLFLQLLFEAREDASNTKMG